MSGVADTLLIDGDVEAFKAAAVAQDDVDWGDTGGPAPALDRRKAEDYLAATLAKYARELDAEKTIVCLSGTGNWRKALWPAYKAHRDNRARPALLRHCRQFLTENYTCDSQPGLEADDMMGLLSTTWHQAIIVSIDKDMLSLPCRLFRPHKPEEGIRVVGMVEAHRNHMLQTLMGDPTDGYKGVPGIGPKKAGALLQRAYSVDLSRSGSVEDMVADYMEERVALWETVLAAYKATGMTAKDALLAARLSYILRNPGDYNWKTKKVKLWKPPGAVRWSFKTK